MTIFRKVISVLTHAERQSLRALLILMIIGMLLETLSVGLVIPVLAVLVRGDLASSYPQLQPVLGFLGNPTQAELIAGCMLALLFVYLIKVFFLGFLAWRQTKFAFGVQMEMSQRLFTTYLRQPYAFHLQRNSAQLMRNITGEVTMFTGVLTQGMSLSAEALVLLGIATLLLAVEPLGALIVAIVLGTAVWGYQRSMRERIARWGMTRHYHDRMRIQHLQQGLHGAKDVKLLGRENDFLSQYLEHNRHSTRVARFQATLQQFPRLWLELLAVGGLVTLVLTMLSQGRDMGSLVPTLGLFAAAAFRLMPSVNRIMMGIQTFRYSLPAINTLHDELQLSVPPPPAANTKPAKEFHDEIRLCKVSFTYPSAAGPAIKDLSFTIKKGESIGFVGPSGSGKSTLVDVVLGLLTPSSGKVMVDGQDIEQDLRAWQDQIGYVAQSIYLTDDTLRRNVAFGVPSDQIDDTAVVRAIKAAQLEEFANQLPNKLGTIVGERGVRLSGGQRQRIGIARALYHDPPVLVLDEATSALDAQTESEVMAAVNALQGEKTILIVAHRLSTVEHCHTLVRIERGQIVREDAARQMRDLAAPGCLGV